MKKFIVFTIIIILLSGISIGCSIPPEKNEWDAYLLAEQDFFEWRDTVAPSLIQYDVLDSDGTVIYTGNLADCKAYVSKQLTTDYTIMPSTD